LIKKRIEKLEKHLGKGRILVFFIEADGKIMHAGQEITRGEYDNLKESVEKSITIIDDIEDQM
jgi:hypothetical protein